MFYEKHCSKLVTDMTQVVVAVGLVTITANYIRTSNSDISLLQNPDFWHRSVLLGLTILFAAYHLLIYAADSKTSAKGDTNWGRSSETAIGVIFLFLIDLLGLAAMGAMFGVLAIGQPSPEALNEVFSLNWRTLAWLAGLAATWHVLITIWHLVAESKLMAWLTHLGFAGAHICLVILALASDGPNGIGLPMPAWTIGFALVIVALYITRGRRVLQQSIAIARTAD